MKDFYIVNSYANLYGKRYPFVKDGTKEFLRRMEDDGYVDITNDDKLGRVRANLQNNHAMFFPYITAGSIVGGMKYSSIDLFGAKMRIYFNPEKKENVAHYLVGKFIAANPKPSLGLKHAFTKFLHSYGLHWYQCAKATDHIGDWKST